MMRKKVLIANLNGLKVTQTAGLYQYDYGQELNILGTGITSAIEIHYTNGGNAMVTLANPDGDTLVSQIPDELLESSGTITAYIYYTDETSGQTVYKVIIPVIERAKPEDYTPTEREKTLAEEAIEALEKNLLFVNTEKTEDGAEITITDRNGNHIVNLSNGEDGEPGEDGNGIESIEQTTTSTASEGVNVVTVTMTDGETATFEIRNGARGEKGEKGDKGDKGEKGDNGEDGVGIASLVQTKTSSEGSGVNEWTATLTDGSTHTFEVKNGKDATFEFWVETISDPPGGYMVYAKDTSGQITSFSIYNGHDGADGQDGQDGDDYVLTAADKQEIADIVIAEIGSADTTAY